MPTLTLPWSWFTWVKCVVYAWLIANLDLFFLEDLGSWRHQEVANLSLTQVVGVFAQTLDTGASHRRVLLVVEHLGR